MLHMYVCMHSYFVKNHPICILKDGLLISEVVQSQTHHQPRNIGEEGCRTKR
jgi:hypothetical protein